MLVGEGIEYRPAENRSRTAAERSRGGPFFISDQAKTRFEELVREVFVDEMQRMEHFEVVTRDEVVPVAAPNVCLRV